MAGVLVVLAALAWVAFDRAVDYTVDQRMVPDIVESTGPELLREATEFGGWVLPADAEVLLVQREIIRDRTYRIAVRTTPDGLAAMLAHSRFPHTPAPGNLPARVRTIAGPPLETSPSVEFAQQAWFTSATGRVMIRDIAVDVRAETVRIAHIEFRGV